MSALDDVVALSPIAAKVIVLRVIEMAEKFEAVAAAEGPAALVAAAVAQELRTVLTGVEADA